MSPAIFSRLTAVVPHHAHLDSTTHQEHALAVQQIAQSVRLQAAVPVQAATTCSKPQPLSAYPPAPRATTPQLTQAGAKSVNPPVLPVSLHHQLALPVPLRPPINTSRLTNVFLLVPVPTMLMNSTNANHVCLPAWNVTQPRTAVVANRPITSMRL